ncbi:carbohydrate-binding family 9-like protein [Autumnicola musiva]|uniref:Carbohydrate-binding family 9-like protein n=1 Tax=Autumnicola musiva TaxID=3075589 RepID=A0ABU3DAK5_9FLAO|nr:carbohydrate-binding family 9-like protein [Zunongwangia sp. F117]MDT0678562.1 carbohydrate-binding family 9-like protein [Zunongwangia sp. F117]
MDDSDRGETEIIEVKKTSDFELNGKGENPNWNSAEWITLPQRNSSVENQLTRAKVLYSENGIYFLFYCEDKELTATMNSDFEDLWNEDVVEVFLWPNNSAPVYFEYEISPLDYELPILVSNEEGNIVRWMPFHYDSDRRTRHATSVEGGEKRSHSKILSWKAEFFIPFQLLRPLLNITPGVGSMWKGNICRIDYQREKAILWSKAPIETSFHEYEHFANFLFQ